jgi:hypothetical protein
MTQEEYWPKVLKGKKGTRRYLRGQRFYYDFDWNAVFTSSKDSWSRFPGLKTVSEVVASYVPGGDWSDVVIILTTEAEHPLKHDEVEGKHFFVFDAQKLQNRKYTATTAFLGLAASNAPEMLDAYQLYKQSPDALRKGMLAADAHVVLSGLHRDEARGLLPIALGVLTRALDEVPNQAESPMPGGDALDEIDIEALTRALQVLLAKARDRGDVSAVLSVLDGLDEERRAYFQKNPEIVKLVAEEDIATIEVTSWAYRRCQIQVYEEMLDSEEGVKAYKEEHDISKIGEEPAWQHYFERNQWIFGLALNYHFNEAISDRRLEVYSKGPTFLEEGKRPDAVMATVALIRSLCFVEIKTPRKSLMGKKYRDDAWGPSNDLVGAVAQSQKAVYRSVLGLKERFRLMDDEGAERGEPIYTVHPRSFVVIGTIREFLIADGADKTKLIASFELFRRGLIRPEVITFDELLERAKRLATPSAMSTKRNDNHKDCEKSTDLEHAEEISQIPS